MITQYIILLAAIIVTSIACMASVDENSKYGKIIVYCSLLVLYVLFMSLISLFQNDIKT